MSSVDWDNAPEGAEFYNTALDCWYRVMCGSVWVFGEPRWWDLGWRPSVLDGMHEAIKRPQTQPKPKYEYGVEYPTNGQKPDLPDDVLVDVKHDVFSWIFRVNAAYRCWGETVAFRIVDERYKPEQPEITQEPSNKYSRQIVGLDGKTCQIDVYRVLAAFEVGSHPVAHAIKKLLAPGMRHAKTREQDLREAIASIEAELLMMEQRE